MVGLRHLALIAAVTLSSGISLGWARVGELQHVADGALNLVQAERQVAGIAPLERRAELDAVARQRARDIASLPFSRRMQRTTSIERLLKRDGVRPFKRAYEQVHYLNGHRRPSRGMFEGWRKKKQSWRAAMSGDTDAVGVASFKADDGWVIMVAVLVDDLIPPEPLELDRLESRTLEAINEERRRRGRSTLDPSPRLSSIAREHSQDMARRDFFDHENPSGQGPAQRVKARGVVYRSVSENLFVTNNIDDAVREAVRGWMDSPPHRKNLLDRSMSVSGVGIALDEERGLLYFTQLFMEPR